VIAAAPKEGLWRWALDASASAVHLLPVRVAVLGHLLPERMTTRSLPELLRELTPNRLVTREAIESSEIERLESVVESILQKSRVLHTTCLYRALVRYALLRQAGADVSFVMGVREDDGDVVGHAWIEANERPWREDLRYAYRQTFRYPT
jgi:hypothetical protein